MGQRDVWHAVAPLSCFVHLLLLLFFAAESQFHTVQQPDWANLSSRSKNIIAKVRGDSSAQSGRISKCRVVKATGIGMGWDGTLTEA